MSDSSAGWQGVTLPWYEATKFNPSVDPKFEGVELWAPERVSLGETSGRLPVFGVVQLGQQTIEQLAIGDGHPLRAVVVGATLRDLDEVMVANAVSDAPLFEATSGGVVTEHFALDLIEGVRLPRSPGEVFVFASVGPMLSRPRKITVTP